MNYKDDIRDPKLPSDREMEPNPLVTDQEDNDGSGGRPPGLVPINQESGKISEKWLFDEKEGRFLLVLL